MSPAVAAHGNRSDQCLSSMADSAAVTDSSSAAHAKVVGGAATYGPFAYLSAPNAPIYRRVMRALMAEKERFTVHVRPEQVRAALCADGGGPVEEDAVSDALGRLADPNWG